jgi:hypothetical protein
MQQQLLPKVPGAGGILKALLCSQGDTNTLEGLYTEWFTFPVWLVLTFLTRKRFKASLGFYVVLGCCLLLF